MCRDLCTYAPLGGSRSVGESMAHQTPRRPCRGGGATDVERKCLTVKVCAASAESPCRSCCLAADPDMCSDTDCILWQRWFVSKWNAARQKVGDQYRQGPIEEVGVAIGGRRYAPPHRRREFLAEDPCRRCRCPKELCQGECQLRQLWLAGKQEVGQ